MLAIEIDLKPFPLHALKELESPADAWIETGQALVFLSEPYKVVLLFYFVYAVKIHLARIIRGWWNITPQKVTLVTANCTNSWIQH